MNIYLKNNIDYESLEGFKFQLEADWEKQHTSLDQFI